MSLQIEVLKESAEFLAILLDNISSAILIVDKNIQIQNVNNSLKVLLVKDEDQIINQLCGNVLGCQFAIDENKNCGETSNCNECTLRSSLVQTFFTQIPSNKQILKRDFYIDHKRLTKYFQYTTKYLSFQDEEMVIVIIDDLTDLETQKIKLEQQNQALQKINDQKNEILGIAAHDLRNPLNQIISLVQMLNDPTFEVTSQNRSKFLGTIQERGKFALSLINDLLDFSTIEAGKLNLEKKPVNYNDFIAHIVELNIYLAKHKNIQIHFDLPERKIQVNMDVHKVEQVLGNLITNAIKFSNPFSTIEIRIEEQESKLLTMVTDHGVGIDTKVKDTLFTAFKKGAMRGTLGEEGSGLGLAISKRIIEAHGGEIGLESNPGKGSTFWYSLPLEMQMSDLKF